MARRPQIGANVPFDVREWVEEARGRADASQTRFVMAGYILLASVADAERDEAVYLSSMLDRELIEWSDVEAYVREPRKGRVKLIAALKLSVLGRMRRVPKALLDQKRDAANAVELAAKKAPTTSLRRHKEG